MKMKYNKSKNGFVLIDALISIQILLIIVVFIVTVAMYHQSTLVHNVAQQSAIYSLQSFMEEFISEQTRASRMNGMTGYESSEKNISSRSHPEIQLLVSWQAIDYNLAIIHGEAIWVGSNGRQERVTFSTTKFVH